MHSVYLAYKKTFVDRRSCAAQQKNVKERLNYLDQSGDTRGGRGSTCHLRAFAHSENAELQRHSVYLAYQRVVYKSSEQDPSSARA